MTQAIATLLGKMTGWKISGKLPDAPKFVMIGFPHTSNWDFLLFVYLVYKAGVSIHFFGKASLFSFPIKYFLYWLGGVPIDRSSHHGVVDESINIIKQRDQFVLGLMPEGTRNPADKTWKTGFYHVAKGADIPIVLAVISHKYKTIHLCEPLNPSGDLKADIKKLKDYTEKTNTK